MGAFWMYYPSFSNPYQLIPQKTNNSFINAPFIIKIDDDIGSNFL